MRKNTPPFLLLPALAAALMAGCAAPPASTGTGYPQAAPPASAPRPAETRPPAPPPPAPPVAREPSASEKALTAALETFDRGDYPAAIRQLTPLSSDATLDKESQLRALRSLAFAQCLTRALVPCRQTFERAFRLDNRFDLAPAERGHPIWGPQFERARKAVLG